MLVTIGLEETTIVGSEDNGTVEVCISVLEGQLDRQFLLTGNTSDGTATSKTSDLS